MQLPRHILFSDNSMHGQNRTTDALPHELPDNTFLLHLGAALMGACGVVP
jgi:hypothetical protein